MSLQKQNEQWELQPVTQDMLVCTWQQQNYKLDVCSTAYKYKKLQCVAEITFPYVAPSYHIQ
jgi:hypothetical protein